MYFQLTEALKRRFILELRRFWEHHPKFTDLPDHIQGKYSFREQPQEGIVIKTSGGNRVDLSADNYMGIVNSYVYMAKFKDSPGFSLEWVREDSVAIQNNAGKFPCPPGIYFVEITKDATDGTNGEFYVDPLLDQFGEQVTGTTTTEFQLQNAPLANTLRLYEMPARFQLVEGTNYTLTLDPQGKPTGAITLNTALTGGRWLVADYRYPGETSGPHTLVPMHAHNKAIPGVVLAFGRRSLKGDKLAVVIQDVRRPAYLQYGGRWDLNLDVEVFSRDVYAQQEICDNSVIYLWAVARPRMSTEGIEISDIALGGESEEVYDETGDDYFYQGNFSITAQTDWFVHVPLNVMLRQVAPLTAIQANIIAGLEGDDLTGQVGNIQVLESLGLEEMNDPFFAGKNATFETIK